ALQAGGGLSSSRSDDAIGACPCEFEPRAAQPPREEPARADDVAEQRDILCGRVDARPQAVCSPHIFVMDEKLVEVRESTYRPESEEAGRRAGSNHGDECVEVALFHRGPPPFSEPPPRAGNHQPRSGEVVVFAEDEMCGEVTRRPRAEERRRVRAQ